MKKNNFIIFIFFSLLISFYKFDSSDWFFVSKPDIIKSMTQDTFNAYFLAENGIYSYDFISEDFFYDIDLSNNLLEEKKYLIHYHSDTDYFFIFTQNHILYKSSIASYWNEKRISDLNIFSINSIIRIGFSNEDIIIQTQNDYKVINIFSMNNFNYKDIDHIQSVQWVSNNVDDLDLSKYYTMDNSIMGKNNIRDIADIHHFPISSMYDRFDNLWIGMDTGAIYKVDDFSYNIERLNVGPRVDYVSDVFNDSYGNWYFFDSYFKRTGSQTSINKGYFISIWNENNDSWIHIPKNDNLIISNAILNDVKRLDDFILFCTFDGLIIYDIKLDSWYHNYNFLDNYNRALWEVIFDDKNIYFATSFGLVICDYLILDDKLEIYRDNIIFRDSEIYDLEILDNKIYFSSSEGLYKYNLDLNKINLIDSHIYYKIKIFENYVLASNNNLWNINNLGRTLISHDINYFNTSDKGDKICATNLNQIKIIDNNSEKEWYLSLKKINMNRPIYSIDCDSDWLWFPNVNGIAFFKWSNYE